MKEDLGDFEEEGEGMEVILRLPEPEALWEPLVQVVKEPSPTTTTESAALLLFGDTVKVTVAAEDGEGEAVAEVELQGASGLTPPVA